LLNDDNEGETTHESKLDTR